MPRQQLIADLQSALGPASILHEPEDLLVFEYDAYLEAALPEVVVQPGSPEEVAAAVRIAALYGRPVVARGGATGLSGGVVPIQGGVVVDLNRMCGVLDLQLDDRLARVEPGLINSELSTAVAADGFFYAPDPSSQRASTIGGNIAENAGGPHCLAQGMTANHVVGLELVAGDGERYRLGGPAPDVPGYDLVGVVVGSEGTLGIVTEAWLRLVPLPPSTLTFLALFDRLELAGEAVSRIVAGGIIPSALELIDGGSARAIEAAFKAGLPADIEGILLIDLDGLPEKTAAESSIVERVCRELSPHPLRFAESAAERDALWAARKGALAAITRIAPNYYLHDMVVPRSRMAALLRRVLAVGAEYGFFVSNVAHAGDGNLHPTIMFDIDEDGILERVVEAGEKILRIGVEAGGTISGEHGIGLEKQQYMAWIFSPADLAVMCRVREAFSPGERFNPGKLFPQDPPRPMRLKARAGATVTTETWI
jgi:glycolate oxidase